MISEVVLENNGINDSMLAYVVSSLEPKAQDLAKLAIVKNEIGLKASKALFELVSKSLSLEELKIDTCKIIGTAIEDLVDKISID